MCLAKCGASEAIYPCNVKEKIREYFNAPISLENKISCSLTTVACRSFLVSTLNLKMDKQLILSMLLLSHKILTLSPHCGIHNRIVSVCISQLRKHFFITPHYCLFKSVVPRPLSTVSSDLERNGPKRILHTVYFHNYLII